MHSLTVLADSVKDLVSYARDDRRYFGFAALLVVVLAVVDTSLLPQLDRSRHDLTAFGLDLSSVLVPIAGSLVFFSIALRSYTWLMRKPFDFLATLRSLGSYIGPSITTIICIFLFYVLVPVIVIFIATSSITDKELKALLRSEIVGCYSILISFGAMYSLPLLVIERKANFRNVLSALKLSVKEPKLTCMLVLPGSILTLFVWTGLVGEPDRTYIRVFTEIFQRAVLLLALFVYFSLAKKTDTNGGEAL